MNCIRSVSNFISRVPQPLQTVAKLGVISALYSAGGLVALGGGFVARKAIKTAQVFQQTDLSTKNTLIEAVKNSLRPSFLKIGLVSSAVMGIGPVSLVALPILFANSCLNRVNQLIHQRVEERTLEIQTEASLNQLMQDEDRHLAEALAASTTGFDERQLETATALSFEEQSPEMTDAEVYLLPC